MFLMYSIVIHCLPTGKYTPGKTREVKIASPPSSPLPQHELTQRASFVFTDNKGKNLGVKITRAA